MSKKVRTEYNTEFRQRVVNLPIHSDKSIAQIARDLGVKKSTLYTWVNKVKMDRVKDSELNTEELFDELKRVKNGSFQHSCRCAQKVEEKDATFTMLHQ